MENAAEVSRFTARPATPEDAEDVCRIYNHGIAERGATFETRPRTPAEIAGWFGGVHPVIVVESGGAVVAFAAAFPYRPRDCYAGIAEFSVYVDPVRRGEGAGRAAMQGLIAACETVGFWKLLSRIFVENAASLSLLRSLGFREVGVYEKHGILDGVWRDVVIVERLLPENQK